MRLTFRAGRRQAVAPFFFATLSVLGIAAAAQARQAAPAQAAAPAAGQAAGQVVVHATWDSAFIYFAFQVDDTDITGTNARPLSHPEQDDSVAVYFQTDTATGAPDAGTHALLVSVAQGFTLLDGDPATKTLVVPKKPNFGIKYGVNVQGTLNRSDDRDKGYTITLAVPFSLLGIDTTLMKPGKVIGFNAVVRSRSSKGLTSLSPAVKSETDVADPSKWTKLTLIGPPSAAGAGSNGAGGLDVLEVEPKTAPPLIDGNYRGIDWPVASKATFGSPDVPRPVAAVPTTAETTAKTDFTAQDMQAPVLDLSKPINGLPTQLMARYQPDYQADRHKSGVPTHGVFSATGIPTLADQPVTGIGPWFSGDRVSYHRNQLAAMRRDGIDVALVELGGLANITGPDEEKALMTLVTALRELATAKTPTPTIALCIDADRINPTGALDLSQDDGRDGLYAAIRHWMAIVPPEFRARVRVPSSGDSPVVAAYPVFLTHGSAVKGIADPLWADTVRARFATEFGVPTTGTTLLFAGIGSDWSAAGSKLAAVLPSATGAGTGSVNSYLLQPTSPTGRHNGSAYHDAWEAALNSAPTWLVIDSWNDFGTGTEVAASRQYGTQYEDTTRLYAIQASGLKNRAIRWIDTDAPRRMAPGQVAATVVTVQNIGRETLSTTDGYRLVYRWRHNGEVVAESPVPVALGHPLLPTLSLSQPIGLSASSFDGVHLNPLPPGEYTVEFDIAQTGADGKPMTLLSAGNDSPPLRIPVTISADLADYVQFGGTTTPNVLRAGETVATGVRLRWMGANPLALGEANLIAQVITEDGKTAAATSVTPLPATLEPGQWVTVPVKITLAEATVPIPPANPPMRRAGETAPGGYRIRYLLTRTNSTTLVPGEYNDQVAVYPADDEAIVEAPVVPPTTFDAAARVTFNTRIVNNGTTKWAKGGYAVGYHWYDADGLETEWKPALSSPLPDELKPGQAVVIPADLRTPDHEGDYILAIDVLRNGDQTFLSTLPGGREASTALLPIRVRGGERLRFVDLTSFFDVDAIAGEAKPADGNLDGSGNTLAAESFPPDRFGIIAQLAAQSSKSSASEHVAYPSGYYVSAEPLISQTAFRYGSSTDGAKNAIRCAGQTIPIPRGKTIGIHIAATTTGGTSRPLAITFHYHDGSKETITDDVPDWNSAAGPTNVIALNTRLKRNPTGDAVGPANIWHLIYGADTHKDVDSISLANDPNIKVFAITVER